MPLAAAAIAASAVAASVVPGLAEGADARAGLSAPALARPPPPPRPRPPASDAHAWLALAADARCWRPGSSGGVALAAPFAASVPALSAIKLNVVRRVLRTLGRVDSDVGCCLDVYLSVLMVGSA